MPVKIVFSSVLLLNLAPVLHAQSPDSVAAPDSAVVALEPLYAVASIAGLIHPGHFPAASGQLARIGSQDLRLAGHSLVSATTTRMAASMHDDLGSPAKPTLTMRGFAVGPVVGMPQGISVLVDGVPVNEPAAGEVNFDLLPVEFAQLVEVSTGTAALLGANSLGGAINLITQRGGEYSRGEIELETGAYGVLGGRIELAGPAGALRYFAGGLHDREDGWRQHMRSERTLAHFAAERTLPGGAAGVRLTAARSRAETAGSLPMSVYAMRPDSNLTAGDFELVRQISMSAFLSRSAAAGVAAAQLFVRAGDAERFNVNQQADPDVRGFSSSRTIGLQLDWLRQIQAAASGFSFRAGTGGLLNRSAVSLFAERIDPGITTDVESPIARANAYAVTAFQRGRWYANLGVRADLIRVPFRNQLDHTRDTVSTFFNVSPRASVEFVISPNIALLGALSTGFRPPALIELACADPEQPCPLPFALGDDPPLDPVSATTVDGGLRWISSRTSAALTAFRSAVRNDIFLFPYDEDGEPDGSTIDGFFDNVPHTRRVGLEARLSTSALPRVVLGASYAYVRATFETDDLELFSIREEAGQENEVSAGDRFPLVPDHSFSVSGTWTISSRLLIGAEMRYVGRRYLRGDEANNEAPLEAYATTDALVEAGVRDFALAVRLRNVFDTRYFTFGTYNINQGNGELERFVTPGAPRRLELSVRRAWSSLSTP